MSHFSTVRVQIKNGTVLHEALLDLGHNVVQNAEVRGYQGKTTTADYVVRQGNGYDLGFRKQAEAYELVADFWGAKIDQQQFINSVTQKYAHKMLMQTASQQGFNVEEEEIMQDGTVRVVVGRWV
ncbi:DUF1257 domain-containing protein [filamentous cyanobacterium LEGE 11480]|uniref:DUF1257 domain-containing protein n=1 Tax=Romeriopsis navalis LEGE 11480 TaxID=2777977 RepID=A0A928Z346_9CYAN|nr:DUF1257 domain-containing protein [Romeriopsis navalis]MBE9031111.1 DUF1257 domain-containing protein [Romeriopsis navalis LEGE 11480]